MALPALTCVALKARCQQIGARVSGPKPDLIERLLRAADPLNSCDHPSGDGARTACRATLTVRSGTKRS
eukprot:11782761-Heterocapsa_arctica.AAC.1